MNEKFKKNWDKIVVHKPLLFSSFTPLIYPDNDETKKHIMIVGPTGTGKSIMIQTELRNSFYNEQFMFLGLSFSAQTSANQTQLIIDNGMERSVRVTTVHPLERRVSSSLTISTCLRRKSTALSLPSSC